MVSIIAQFPAEQTDELFMTEKAYDDYDTQPGDSPKRYQSGYNYMRLMMKSILKMVLRNKNQLIISQITFLSFDLVIARTSFAKIKPVRVAGVNIINDDFLLFLLRSANRPICRRQF